MFNKNKENKNVLDKKTGKKYVKEATTALIVVNQSDGILSGDPEDIRRCGLVIIKSLCERGITSPMDIVGFMMSECDFMKEVAKPKKKVKKEVKEEKAKRGRPKKVSEEK